MRKQQRGITLIVSLIMLVLLTIMALSSLNIGTSSLQLADNAQQAAQAANAAQGVVEQIISSPAFVDTPAAVLSNSVCPSDLAAPSNSTCVDLYGDAKTTVLVALSPQPACIQTRTVTSGELDLGTSEGLGCSLGETQNFGISGAASGASLCADTTWEINVKASEAVSNAEAKITQGVAMRVSADAATTACP